MEQGGDAAATTEGRGRLWREPMGRKQSLLHRGDLMPCMQKPEDREAWTEMSPERPAWQVHQGITPLPASLTSKSKIPYVEQFLR